MQFICKLSYFCNLVPVDLLIFSGVWDWSKFHSTWLLASHVPPHWHLDWLAKSHPLMAPWLFWLHCYLNAAKFKACWLIDTSPMSWLVLPTRHLWTNSCKKQMWKQQCKQCTLWGSCSLSKPKTPPQTTTIKCRHSWLDAAALASGKQKRKTKARNQDETAKIADEQRETGWVSTQPKLTDFDGGTRTRNLWMSFSPTNVRSPSRYLCATPKMTLDCSLCHLKVKDIVFF